MKNLSLILKKRILDLSTLVMKDATYLANLTPCFSLTRRTPCSLALYSKKNVPAIISLVTKSRLRSFSTYKNKKSNPLVLLYIEWLLLYDIPSFTQRIISTVSAGVSYKVFVKFGYNYETYKMGFKQFGFLYHHSDYSNITNLAATLESIMSLSMAGYGHSEYPTSILIHFRPCEGEVKVNLKEFILNKVKKRDVKVYDFSKNLSLSMDSRNYGVLLTPLFSSDRVIIGFKQTHLIGDEILFPNFGYNYMQQKKIMGLNFNDIINCKDDDLYYLLGNGLLLYIPNSTSMVEIKYIYDSSAVLISVVSDTVINSTKFSRKIGNISLTIEKEKVILYSVDKNLNAITPTLKEVKGISNPLFGVLDLETYVDDNGFSKVYAAGFYTKDKLNTYYIDKATKNSSKVVLDCLDGMLVAEYDKYKFYVHNLSGYDAAFILKIIVNFNSNAGSEIYYLEPIYRDGRIISLTIKKQQMGLDGCPTKKRIKITLIDSYLMLSSKLANLGKAYEVDVVKGSFPHSFASVDTLFYIGPTPSIDHYNDIDSSSYLVMLSDHWNFKEQCIQYLTSDLVSLFLIMNKFKKAVYISHGVEALNALTISRLSYDIFMTKHYKNNIALIKQEELWTAIQSAYFGGVSEVYKPYGEKLYYYDVNSLYPFAALNPMPGLKCTYIDFVNNEPDLSSLFGFYHCEVESGDNYLGLLPVKTDTGSIILPNGKWSGTYWSEELKFAQENGFKITVKFGYSFNRELDVFEGFVNDLYKTKVESTNNVMRNISKSLLNNFFGRFAMSILKPITNLVDDLTLDELSSKYKIINTIRIEENVNLTTFDPKISKEICEEFGLDYVECLNKKPTIKSIAKTQSFNDVNIAITASVNSYARIHMGKIKLDLLSKGYNLYYTDTDSLVVDRLLDDSLVGTELGKFKLEHTIKRGYFISSKLYCIITDSNKVIAKAKGGESNTLTEVDFINLLNKKNVEINKTQSKIDYSAGSVDINKISIMIQAQSYKNRKKIYNTDGLWIDTYPHTLGINEHTTDDKVISYDVTTS